MRDLLDRELLVPTHFIYFVCNGFNEFDSTSMFMGNMCGYHVLYLYYCINGLFSFHSRIDYCLCLNELFLTSSRNKQGDQNLKSMRL